MTRKKNYKPGDVVWTQGCESGAWYECRVIEPCDPLLYPGEYLLAALAHGDAIFQRHWSEMERSPE